MQDRMLILGKFILEKKYGDVDAYIEVVTTI